MIEFKLPSLGADMDEGKLLEWRIKPGDRVKRGDIVAVVDTSKAAVDIEIWDEGMVHELMVQPDATIPVGTVMAILLAPGEAAPARTENAAPAAPAAVATPQPVAPPAAEAPAPMVVAQAPAPTEPAPIAAARRRVSPAARRRAQEAGLDPQLLSGSGPEDAVTLDDVERALAARPAGPTAAVDRAMAMRQAMAAAMARSKREIPHYYLAQSVALRYATRWLDERNARQPLTERVLLAVLFIKALALACRKHPAFNGFHHADRFVPAEGVHVGVAIALRGGGLVAPALHDAERKDLGTLMRELADLVKRARAGSLKSSEMANPTITLTNLGESGAESVFGVIYPPQVALVGFGAVADRAWVENGTLGVMPCVTLSLAADHRVSTGHQGALFLAEIGRLLQQPDQL